MKKTALFAALMLLGTGVQAEDAIDTKYQQTCFACHGTGAMGAPKTGDKAAWEPRLAKGMPTLVEHVKNGFQGTQGMMPAKGLCNDCTDDDFKKLIEKMSK